jgi:peptide/nickel transport system ATP-binding protein
VLAKGAAARRDRGGQGRRLLESIAVTPLLSVENLMKLYAVREGRGMIRAVDGVSLTLAEGETLGIVGESGCGKSTLARLILRLIGPTSGSIKFDGEDLSSLSASALRRRRRDMQIVFQDPYASLDPRMTIGRIIAEPLAIHGIGPRRTRRDKVMTLLGLVGLDEGAADRYPHEFSGGQRQRIGIARALALEPRLVVLDEPVSALDVSIQSQILNLLMDLKERLKLSYIFISHDLGVVEHVSDRVAVMYLGRIVEEGNATRVFNSPLHPYTEALISAIPSLDPALSRKPFILTGDLPSPDSIPQGCRFHPRCPKTMDVCRSTPPAITLGPGGVSVECHLY